MSLEQKYKKHFVAVTCILLMSLMFVGVATADITIDEFGRVEQLLRFKVLEEQRQEELKVEKQTIIGGFVAMVVGTLVAVHLFNASLPSIASVETSTNLDENEQGMVGLIPMLMIFGIISFVVGFIVL